MLHTRPEQAVIDAAERIMIDTMARYDPSHDAYHGERVMVQRVRNTALKIAMNVPTQPDLLVIELAALLHDVLDKKYVSAEQAADPYKFFLPFFESMAYLHGIDLVKDGRGRFVAQIIDNVSWSTEKNLKEKGLWTEWHKECVELHCVQDADRLDAIGAFGILRCAAYTTTTNQPLYAPAGDPKQPQSAIQHFHDKLILIRDRLKTEYGKRLATKRHQLLLDFITAVDEEYNVFDSHSSEFSQGS
ncbi:hypothetical protein E4T56_gene20396 [Termitomyces sp. T112]|nr:hypothetical protein E4T56_gene20396 [Termitomyces sp. T112]